MIWKGRPGRNADAFTRTELVVVVVVVFVVAMLMLQPVSRPGHGPRISCLNNLRQIAVAYLLWANDHNDRFPASESVANGGWRELLTNGDQGANCWTNYMIMADDLGQIAKLLLCAADQREYAMDFFTNGPTIHFKDNTTLSYFVGVSASLNTPQSILGGDRNLGPGTVPDPDYGFSSANGLGNDVAIQTNFSSGPISWSLKMHSRGNSAGGGNIILGDGSGQEVTSASFRQNRQPSGGVTTNWPAGHVPSSPSFRVIFP
jgi:hypothetical protein